VILANLRKIDYPCRYGGDEIIVLLPQATGAEAMKLAENDTYRARVEKVSLSKTGDDWFAMRENEPTIYQLDANVVDELQKTIAAVKAAAPAKSAKK